MGANTRRRRRDIKEYVIATFVDSICNLLATVENAINHSAGNGFDLRFEIRDSRFEIVKVDLRLRCWKQIN